MTVAFVVRQRNLGESYKDISKAVNDNDWNHNTCTLAEEIERSQISGWLLGGLSDKRHKTLSTGGTKCVYA